VYQLLEDEEMQMKDYLRLIYPDVNIRTIHRKQEVFAHLVASIPASVLKRLGSATSEVLGRFDRIAAAALGDIKNAVKEIPQQTPRKRSPPRKPGRGKPSGSK
jgi:hypothetical protein